MGGPRLVTVPGVPTEQDSGSTALPSLPSITQEQFELVSSFLGGTERAEAGFGRQANIQEAGGFNIRQQQTVTDPTTGQNVIRFADDEPDEPSDPVESGIAGIGDITNNVPSQFRGDAGDYDPKTGALPQNTGQAYVAIAYAQTLAINVYQGPDGGWFLGELPLRDTPADKELIQAALLRDTLLSAASAQINGDLEQIAGEGALQRDKNLANAQAALNSQLQTELEELRSTNAAELAQATAEEQRVTIREEFRLREKELKENQTRMLAQLAAETNESAARAEKERDLQLTVLEFTNDLQVAMQDAQLNFQAEEAKLDRHLQQQEIDEAISSRQAMNLLDVERLRIQDAQLKMSFVSMIAQSPEFIFNAQRSGMLQSLGDFLGDGGQLVEQMNELVVAASQQYVNAQGMTITVGPSSEAQAEARAAGFKPVGQAQSQLLNVQQFGRLSDVEQRRESFRSRALQGGTAEQFIGRLGTEAPRSTQLSASEVGFANINRGLFAE